MTGRGWHPCGDGVVVREVCASYIDFPYKSIHKRKRTSGVTTNFGGPRHLSDARLLLHLLLDHHGKIRHLLSHQEKELLRTAPIVPGKEYYPHPVRCITPAEHTSMAPVHAAIGLDRNMLCG